jgi:hypothetical protein
VTDARPGGVLGTGRVGPFLLLAGVLCLVLAAWLLVPRPDPTRLPSLPGLRAVLVDTSASVVRRRPEWSSWVRSVLRDECEAARLAGEELLIIECDSEVSVQFGPADPEQFLPRLTGRTNPYRPAAGAVAGRDQESRLAQGLGVLVAEVLASGRATGRVRLLGDGRPTDAPGRLLARLESAGVPVELRTPPPAGLSDIDLKSVRMPQRLEVGAPLFMEVNFALALSAGAAPEEVAIELAVNYLTPGASGTGIRVDVRAPRGRALAADGRLHWSTLVELPPPPAGRHVVHLRARCAEPERLILTDPVPENDSIVRAIVVEGAIVCAVVVEPSLRAELEVWCASPVFEGVQFVHVTPGELPTTLRDADLLLTCDVGPGELPAEIVRSFLQRGGGWVAFGGWNFLRGFEAGSTDERALQRVLPIDPDPGDAEPRDVALLVDGSGSMAGEPFERVRSAVLDLVLSASPRDRMELRFFTGALGPVVFQSDGEGLEARRTALAPLLEARVPSGPTDVLYSLGQLVDLRTDAERQGLAILLSDGYTTQDWFPDAATRLRGRLVATRTELRVLAIGANPNRAFLSHLLLDGEEIVEAGNLEGLSALLQREVSQFRVRSGPIGVIATPAIEFAEGTLARSIAAVVGDPGAISNAVRGQLAAGADGLWFEQESGEPLLAVQRVGAGAACSLTTSPVGGWAPQLMQRPGALAPLLRALGRGLHEVDTPKLEFEREDLVLFGVPADWPARLPARLLVAGTLAVAEDVLAEFHLDVPPTGPRASAMRRAERPNSLRGRRPGELLQIEFGPVGAPLLTLALVCPRPLELAAPELPESAWVAAPAPGSRAHGRGERPLGVSCLVLGILLAVSSVFPRRGGQGIGISDRQ